MSHFAAGVLLLCTAAALDATPRALRKGLIDRTTATALMRSATVRFESDGWAEDAARSLRDEGFCVVRAGGAQISDSILESCRGVASARLSDLLARVGRRGVDLWRRDDSGVAADGVGVDASAGAEPFRYLELVHREGTGRYDMPLPWCVDGQTGDVSLPAAAETAFGELHSAMDGVARPVVGALWAEQAVSAEMRAGCVISEPGALAQPSHRDGPDGLVTVFAPLTAFVPRNGPTELSPATHRGGDDSSSVAPLLQPGDVLLFDYRCLHRGLANEGDARREVAYAVYSRQGVRDIQNFPSATTLEYD